MHCLVLKVVHGVPSLRAVHSDDRNSTELPQWLQPQQPFVLKRLDIIGTEELLDKCSSASSTYWSAIQHADHVFAYLPDDTFYFSYTKSNSNFHRSARSLARSLYSSQSFVMPSITPSNDVIVPEENIRRNKRIEIGRSRSQSWVRTELFAVLLFVAAHLFFLSTTHASSH